MIFIKFNIYLLTPNENNDQSKDKKTSDDLNSANTKKVQEMKERYKAIHELDDLVNLSLDRSDEVFAIARLLDMGLGVSSFNPIKSVDGINAIAKFCGSFFQIASRDKLFNIIKDYSLDLSEKERKIIEKKFRNELSRRLKFDFSLIAFGVGQIFLNISLSILLTSIVLGPAFAVFMAASSAFVGIDIVYQSSIANRLNKVLQRANMSDVIINLKKRIEISKIPDKKERVLAEYGLKKEDIDEMLKQQEKKDESSPKEEKINSSESEEAKNILSDLFAAQIEEINSQKRNRFAILGFKTIFSYASAAVGIMKILLGGGAIVGIVVGITTLSNIISLSVDLIDLFELNSKKKILSEEFEKIKNDFDYCGKENHLNFEGKADPSIINILDGGKAIKIDPFGGGNLKI